MATAPARIQRFQIAGELGRGRMGVVYRARDPQLERDVAIKVLSLASPGVREELGSHETLDLRHGKPRTRDDLLAEARMMARLSHPNVLPVFEVGLAEGAVFVVMEYIAGCNLRQWLEEPRDAAQIVDMFAQAARGLAAAHAHGIVHRDFKPDNVLIGDDGRVRVADFGLSRMVERPVAAMVRVDHGGGTPRYMAPELWRGATATRASDVFAFCTALDEALPRDHELRPLLAAGLDADPHARPSLDTILAALAPRQGRRRSRWTLVAAAAVVALAGGGVAIALASHDDGPACDDDPGSLAQARRDALAHVYPNGAVLAHFDRARHGIAAELGGTCKLVRAGTLTAVQAAGRRSCIEHRAIELAAIVEHLVTHEPAATAADRRITELPEAAECAALDLPVPASDRGTTAQLYDRLISADDLPLADPGRERILEALARDAGKAGDRELEARAWTYLGLRRIETDHLAAADEALARGYELALPLRATRLVAFTLAKRGVAAATRNDLVNAKTYAQLALATADKPEITIRTRATVYQILGRALRMQGDPDGAIALDRKTLDLLRTTDEPLDYIKTNAQQDLVMALLAKPGQQKAALALARDNEQLSRRVLGPDNADYGIALNVLAIALRLNYLLPEAIEQRRASLAVLERTLPPDHAAVVDERGELADDYIQLGDYANARAELERVVQLSASNERLAGARAAWLGDLALATFDSGDLLAGVAQSQQAVEELISQLGRDATDTLRYRFQAAWMQLQLERFDEAERAIAGLEDSYRRLGERGAYRLAVARIDLTAQLVYRRHRSREAERIVRTALASLDEIHGADTGIQADALSVLGQALVAQQRWTEARDALDRAWMLDKDIVGPDDRFAVIEIEQAKIAAATGHHDDAVAKARHARDTLARFPYDRNELDDVAGVLARLGAR